MAAVALSDPEHGEALAWHVVSLQANQEPLFVPVGRGDLAKLRALRRDRVGEVSDMRMARPPFCLLAKAQLGETPCAHYPALGELLLQQPAGTVYSPLCQALGMPDEHLAARMAWRAVWGCIYEAVTACTKGWQPDGEVWMVGPWAKLTAMVWETPVFPVEYPVFLEKARQQAKASWLKFLQETKSACTRSAPRVIFDPIAVDCRRLSIEGTRLLRSAGVLIRREIA